MTKEQVIELAKQAGFDTINDKVYVWAGQSYISVELERFAKLVRNAALEEVAHKLPHIIGQWRVTLGPPTVSGEQHVADAIRNLKEPTP